jgi:hypothetical protein
MKFKTPFTFSLNSFHCFVVIEEPKLNVSAMPSDGIHKLIWLLVIVGRPLIRHVEGFSLGGRVGGAVLRLGNSLDSLYDKSSAIRCPFFRRRVADAIDNTAVLMNFLVIRHKSLPWVSDLLDDPNYSPELFSCPGCKPYGRYIKRLADGTAVKTRHLSLSAIEDRIRLDWVGGVTEKQGYYITGKLDSTIYRDDCLFKSPDPDMPVRGLRKYLSAAAQLFDQRQSCAELLSISSNEDGGDMGNGIVEVSWKLSGVINLPWHPTVEPWTGCTKYHLDNQGLIYLHEEHWDISVWRAFLGTLYSESREWSCWKRDN